MEGLKERVASVGDDVLLEADELLGMISDMLLTLRSISKELNKPFDSGDVLREFSRRFEGVPFILAKTLVHPIYFGDKGENMIMPNVNKTN